MYVYVGVLSPYAIHRRGFMRIARGFTLEELTGEYFAIPYGEQYQADASMLSLNESGAFLWQLLEEEADEEFLCEELVRVYHIEKSLAGKAVTSFLELLRERQLLVE